jgi:hypothetical protein
MGVTQFHWRDEGRSLGVDLDQLNNLETAFRRLPHQSGVGVVIGHAPPSRVEPGKPLILRATYATSSDDAHVYVFYRNSKTSGFTKLDLKQEDSAARTWSVAIPADQVVPGFVEYYFGANSGHWSDYDETISQRPPYHVLVNQATTRPVFSYTQPAASLTGTSVSLNVKVEDPSKIESVYVYYKPMPAQYEWLRLAMHSSGKDSYAAAVPLTPEGILYYFEAIDENGNAANYPNFLQQTPYFAIDSWASQK